MSAEKPGPTPLATLGLVVAIPATYALALREVDLQSDNWLSALGWLVFIGGAAVVVLIGRGTFGVVRSLGLAISTWITLTLATVVVVGAAFGEVFAGCDQRTIHSVFQAPVVVAAGVVYAALGYWWLRKGWWWGPPLAVVLTIVISLILAEVLPGVPNPNYPDDCSS